MPPRLPNWFIGASLVAVAGVVLMPILALGALGIVVLAPVLAPAALGIVGFSAAGLVAGTLATVIPSVIGIVAAGSVIAVARSIAMRGAIHAGVYAASRLVAEAAGWAASWFSRDEPEPDPTLIRTQLDSGSDKEKLDAMEWLVALISKGRNVSEYFAQVVKNVASQNLETRKLVYIYLLKYADQDSDLALRFINTFQKDLNDSDVLIQAMALQVLRAIGNS